MVMADTIVIYVRLTNENVEVWRPINAEHIRANTYRIAEQPYDHESEIWEFEPGDEVICEQIQSSDGPIRAAIREV